MKNAKKLTLAACLLTALVSASCSRTELSPFYDGPVLTIEATTPATKSAITEGTDGTFTPKWTKGDQVTVFQTVGTETQSTTSLELSADAQTASFVVVPPTATGSSFTYTAVYPASAVKQDGSVWKATIPAEQTQSGASFDPAADVMVGEPVTSSSQNAKINMAFCRLGSVARIEIKNLPSDEQVQSVKIATDGALISGAYSINPVTGEAEIAATGASSITLTTSEKVAYIRTMSCTTQGLSVVVKTNKGKYGKASSSEIVLKDNTVTCFVFDASSASTPMDGSGTKEDPYVIKTPEDLASISGNLVLDEDTYFSLANDIDLSGVENWVPINPTAQNMRMVLDGNNHTISNLKSTNGGKYTSFAGLLAGTIKNLNFDHCTIETTTPGGVVAGWLGISNASFTAEVDNVHVTNSSVSTLPDQSAQMVIGGFAGRAGGATIKNCSFQGTVTSDTNYAESYTGGFLGELNIGCALSNVSFDGTVTVKGSRYAAGLVGRCYSAAADIDGATVKGTISTPYDIAAGGVGYTAGGTFKNIKVEANISAGCTPNYTGSNYYSYCGGVIGYSNTTNPITIDGCSFKGDINAADGKCVAGIIGQASSQFDCTNCTASGTLKARQFAAGICGYMQAGKYMNASGCTDEMVLEVSTGYVGGIVAMSNAAVPVTISKCTVTGNITGGASYVAGIEGRMNAGGALTITDCKVACDITSTSGVGGLVGDVNSSATVQATATIERCSYIGTVTGTTNVAGLIGKFTKASGGTSPGCTIANCYTKGEVYGSSSYVAGIVGDLFEGASVKNCWSSCKVTGTYGVGGIVARACNVTNLGENYAVDNKITVEGCVAWNPSVNSILDGGCDPAKNYSNGAVVAYSGTLNTLKNCWRRSDLVITGYADTAYNTIDDHADTDASNPLAKRSGSATYYLPYNGKATTATTASAAAKAAGWSTDVWDMSKDEPVLK